MTEEKEGWGHSIGEMTLLRIGDRFSGQLTEKQNRQRKSVSSSLFDIGTYLLTHLDFCTFYEK